MSRGVSQKRARPAGSRYDAGMATQRELIQETNARYWVGTGYKVGERLDPSNPVDAMHARRWLQTYRDLERQNAAGTLVLFHQEPTFARSLAEAVRAAQVARSTHEGDPRYAEAVRAKQQALSDATLWQEMIAARGGTTAQTGLQFRSETIQRMNDAAGAFPAFARARICTEQVTGCATE